MVCNVDTWSLAIFPPSVIALPRKLKAPAGLRKVIPLKEVPGAKLFVLITRTVLVNISESPGAGATSPTQFAGVDQRPFASPPSQRASAAKADGFEQTA